MSVNELTEHPFDYVKPPSDLSAQGLRTWIEQTCEYVGITPTELARRAKVAPSTVNKFLVDQDGKRSLSARTISALVAGARLAHSVKFGAKFTEGRRKPPDTDPAGFTSPPIRVGASVEANVFRGSHLWAVERQFFVSVPIPNSLRGEGGLSGFIGLAVTDDHGGSLFPYGTVLIVHPFDVEKSPLEIGDYFVVSRQNEAGLTEMTIRHFIVSPKGDMWLTSLAPRELWTPDAYLGRQLVEKQNFWDEKFSPTQPTNYRIDFKVFSAILPYSDAFRALKF